MVEVATKESDREKAFTIIVVDDEPLIANLVEEVLTQERHIVLKAHDAAGALHLLKGQRVDLAILDIRLPGTNGVELANAILSVTPEVSIIFMTGFPDDDIAWEAQTVGAKEYLAKPFELAQLVSLVNRVLQQTPCLPGADNIGKKILLVEYDEGLRTLFRLYLKRAGYVVLTAVNSEEGIKIAMQEKPDLILMDIEMPNLNGIQAVRKLKADPQTEPLPVVMFSNAATRENIENAKEAGAQDFINKYHLDTVRFLSRVQVNLKKA